MNCDIDRLTELIVMTSLGIQVVYSPWKCGSRILGEKANSANSGKIVNNGNNESIT